MTNFDGFNFSNFKDFEVHHVRKQSAVALYCNFVALGYDPLVVLDALHWFVAGWFSIHELNRIVKFRDRCLRDFGTPYPELDKNSMPNMFATALFECGIVDGKFNGIPVLDAELPELSLFGD